MAWYRGAVGADSPAQPRLACRVLDYNEDDVRAALALRRWLTERSAELPTVAELDRRWPADPVSAGASAVSRPAG